MENKKLNTTYDFELCDGTTVKLTLAFYYLYQLRSKNKGLYDRYNKIMQSAGGSFDILDMVTICYVAYLCANIDKEDALSEEEFYMLCGDDIKAVSDAVSYLVNPKKRTASEQRS